MEGRYSAYAVSVSCIKFKLPFGNKSIVPSEIIHRFSPEVFAWFFQNEISFTVMYEGILANIKKHISLSAADEDAFCSLLQFRKLRRRQFLLQAGEISKADSYVVKGCLRAYELDDNGQEHVLQFAIEDWWIGDMYSFLSGASSRLNIDCLEDCELLQLSAPALDELYRRVPAFERYFRIMMQNAFVAGQQRVLSSLSKTAAERYGEFLSKYPSIEQRVPDHQIASYLGIAPQSLSRVRRGFLGK